MSTDAGGWFFEHEGKKLGPFNLLELQARTAAKQILPGTRVWASGMPEWVEARGLPMLFPERPDLGMRMLLPVGRSGYAIAAGYLGLCSFIPVISLFAVLFSTLGIFDLKKHPEKTGMGRIVFGYIMGGIFTLLYGVSALFAFLQRH